MCSVHLSIEEKLVLTAGRDGGLQNMELHGIMKLRVAEDRVSRIKVCTINNDRKGIQIQVGAATAFCLSAALLWVGGVCLLFSVGLLVFPLYRSESPKNECFLILTRQNNARIFGIRCL